MSDGQLAQFEQPGGTPYVHLPGTVLDWLVSLAGPLDVPVAHDLERLSLRTPASRSTELVERHPSIAERHGLAAAFRAIGGMSG